MSEYHLSISLFEQMIMGLPFPPDCSLSLFTRWKAALNQLTGDLSPVFRDFNIYFLLSELIHCTLVYLLTQRITRAIIHWISVWTLWRPFILLCECWCSTLQIPPSLMTGMWGCPILLKDEVIVGINVWSLKVVLTTFPDDTRLTYATAVHSLTWCYSV